MVGDPYLNGDFPCFSSYEATNVQCFDCPNKIECRADTERTSRVNAPPARTRARVARVPEQTVQNSAGLVGTVGHSNFKPFQGESQATRFGKVMLLNFGQTFGMTFADFCNQWNWEPSQKGEVVHIVSDAEIEEE